MPEASRQIELVEPLGKICYCLRVCKERSSISINPGVLVGCGFPANTVLISGTVLWWHRVVVAPSGMLSHLVAG